MECENSNCLHNNTTLNDCCKENSDCIKCPDRQIRESINLYVDDLRDCPEGFIVARTVEQSIYYLKKYKVDVLSLDHDLGVDEQGKLLPTGYDLVKHMCQHGLKVNRIYLHTDNPVGRDNMYYTLISARKHGFINKNTLIFRYPCTKYLNK